MMVVEPGRRNMRDEKLASIGVGSGIGHRKHAGLVVAQICDKFVAEFIPGSAGAVAFGAPALDHEFLDDAMEFEIIVKTMVGKVYEIRNGERRFIGEKL